MVTQGHSKSRTTERSVSACFRGSVHTTSQKNSATGTGSATHMNNTMYPTTSVATCWATLKQSRVLLPRIRLSPEHLRRVLASTEVHESHDQASVFDCWPHANASNQPSTPHATMFFYVLSISPSALISACPLNSTLRAVQASLASVTCQMA